MSISIYICIYPLIYVHMRAYVWICSYLFILSIFVNICWYLCICQYLFIYSYKLISYISVHICWYVNICSYVCMYEYRSYLSISSSGAAASAAVWVDGLQQYECRIVEGRRTVGGGWHRRWGGAVRVGGGGGPIRPPFRYVDVPEPYGWMVAQGRVWWGWGLGEDPRGPCRAGGGEGDVPAAGAAEGVTTCSCTWISVHICRYNYADIHRFERLYTCIYVDMSS